MTKPDMIKELKVYGADDKSIKIILRRGEPTYKFNVGDMVKHGGFAETVVKDQLCNGMAYIVECKTDKGEKVEHLVPWTEVRKLERSSEIISTNNDVDLLFHPKDLTELIGTYYYSFGIDTDPEYQRGYVWNEADREELMDSVFKSIDIGKIVLIDKEHAGDTDDWYEILDGKQRLLTLVAYFEDRFPYKGLYYSDLCREDKRKFDNTSVSVAIVRNASKELIYRLFIMLNTAGKSMSSEDMDRALKLYKESIEK